MRLLLVGWAATRLLLLLCLFQVLPLPGPFVSADVEVIYRGWYEVLSGGAYPADDVTWQYPPAAALAILSPGLLPFLGYPEAFYLLAAACDAAVLALLLVGVRRRGHSPAGAWVWVVGLPLLGPTSYARYDVMVTAVAVAALLLVVRRPRLGGVLVAVGALLKVWPALLLVGTARGRATRLAWGAAALTVAGLGAGFALFAPGSLGFLTHQRERGVEVESLGALVFHVARWFGWQGEARMNYGSIEFLGPYVGVVTTVSLWLTAAAFGWLLWWRLRARVWTPTTCAEAAFAAVLLFTVTSRVISPQYMLWLVGLAAVCAALRSAGQRPAVRLVVAAAAVTVLEFPLLFSLVVESRPLGVALIALRNGLLVAAAVVSCAALWRSTVLAPAALPRPAGLLSRPAVGRSSDASAR
ncbi:glycosyltransferase family 87 protein [Streptomyces alkaliterrae]|uniref:DUF2029 domain-containing protein n=1 Tax=Streptomyces alkaliterrae TaxID=2213162 RepID=A0A5P0YWN0_9ACTN|nr:glycosyltransferase family 87 protein [Streptomyces alkaliterrae]MBB1261810.1 DUF2029 domain-containing protein [Streptomyces alkaliterrae]MQS04693.1 DUF2029 domain-containing protein [Streptomyces alkaliterrae]